MRNWYMETRYRCETCGVVNPGADLLGVDPDRRRQGHGVWNSAIPSRPSCPFDDGEVRAVMVKVFLRDASGRCRSLAPAA